MLVNQALWDRLLRLAVGILLLWVVMTTALGIVWAVAIALAGLTLVVTGFVGWCPFYAALKTGTLKVGA